MQLDELVETQNLSGSIIIDDMVVGNSVLIDGKRVFLDEDDFPDYANLPPYTPPSKNYLSTSATSTSTFNPLASTPTSSTFLQSTSAPTPITIPATYDFTSNSTQNVPTTTTTTTTTNNAIEQGFNLNAQAQETHNHVNAQAQETHAQTQAQEIPFAAPEPAPEKPAQGQLTLVASEEEIPEEIEVDGKVISTAKDDSIEEDIPEIIEADESR